MTQELIERLRRWSNDPGDYLTLGDEPPITLMQEAADALQSQSARIAELLEALAAIDKTTFIGVTTDSEQARRVALESAHDIAVSSLTKDSTSVTG